MEGVLYGCEQGLYGQLSNRESLRDLIVAFEAHRAKQYHLIFK